MTSRLALEEDVEGVGEHHELLTNHTQQRTSILSKTRERLHEWIWHHPPIVFQILAGALTLTLISAVCWVGLWGISAITPPLPVMTAPVGDAVCFHCMGGGFIQPGGDFPHFTSEACTTQLKEYFRPTGGKYWQDVQTVATSASSYFLKLARDGQLQSITKPVVVFDIDETSLSNAESFFSFANDSDSLPAITPVLYFYRTLQSLNISVSFITGRKESYRQATTVNLQRAGYGPQCSQLPSTAASPSSVCWLNLYLRTMTDTRLASVYKPEKRKELAALGYTIIGAIGDQFSDLNGEFAAPANFKLPNPVYYLL